VDVSGTKRWILRTRVQGKRHDIGLGGFSYTSLVEARARAKILRKIAREGGDPLAARAQVCRTELPEIAEARNHAIELLEKDPEKLTDITIAEYARRGGLEGAEVIMWLVMRGALAFLQGLNTNELDKPVGSVTYTLMLDGQAGVRSDITVARLEENHFQLGLNGPRDFEWMERHLPEDGSVQVRDISGGTCCVGVWGPQARELVQDLSPDDLSNEAFGFFKARRIYVGEVPVVALRVSYVGELGWELYASADMGLRLWDLLYEAGRPLGVIAGGRGAININDSGIVLRGSGSGGSLATAFTASKARFCLVSFDTDWLYPTAESRVIVHALNASGAQASFVELSSPFGHDAFLLECPELNRVVDGFLRGGRA
jgi:hypothetical protein